MRVRAARQGYREALATSQGSPRGLAVVASLLLAASLGVAFGGSLPQFSSPDRKPTVPASTLIASQNLQAKLPLIEASVRGSGSPLEYGRRATNLVYVVRSGDDFTAVATRFGLRARTVRLVNRLPAGARLLPGQRLIITPTDGAYHRAEAGETGVELAERYRVSLSDLQAQNPGLSDGRLNPNQPVFIPGATEIRLRPKPVAPLRGYRTGGGLAKRLSVSRSLVGAFGSRVGALAWPASGQMSSPFGIRGYAFHPGIDICNAVGTPIHAAKEGVVVSAGWMGAYGYAVDVDHGGGVVTRYGHCSRVVVSAGEHIAAGQMVARMGSTGRSTGPHLHFEVRIHGRAVNPASFF
ncbi:MAG: LysM peptidoglycan-binding domain-containing M23 family metallopeptidase [Candidatus Sericytochromatia bacterium]|nr:LysM peptidoglycan-binding domain-containing M23 family metallopeptidase [Candidatus Sericytochromatia bacterium]